MTESANQNDFGSNNPIRVAISMLTLVPGGMGGSETYARELLKNLANSHSVSATTYVSSNASGFSGQVPEVVCGEIQGGGSTTERIKTIVSGALRGRSLSQRMNGNDLVHFPFTAPVPRLPKNIPSVVTLFDVQHLDLPHLFSRTEKAYRKVYYERAAKDADAVVTISDFAKQSIIKHLGIPSEKIFTAHLGVDPSEFTPNLGPRKRFVLYPARGWQHKNHVRLFDAMRILEESHPDLTLILTGGALDSLENVPANVEIKGLVPTAELRQLYRDASCLVFPSLYEGFGLPPLEAMASGCPVASSTAGSLPEVTGQAAALFDPLSPSDIARGIVEAIERTAELQQLGFAQLEKFSWEQCAKVHEDAYRFALRSRES